MKRDVLWGLAGTLAAMIVVGLILKSFPFAPGARWVELPLFSLAALTAGTGALWIKNRHSLRCIARTGGEIRLMIRLREALVVAARFFLPVLIVSALVRLAVGDTDWGKAISFAITCSVVHGLFWTAYTKPRTP